MKGRVLLERLTNFIYDELLRKKKKKKSLSLFLIDKFNYKTIFKYETNKD